MPLVKGLVEDAMEDVIADNIAPILQDFLTNFVLQSQFDIPPPIDMALNLNSSFDKLNFAEGFGDSYGQIGLAVQVHPSSRGNEIPENAKGPLIRGGATPTFANAPNDYEFGIALKDDLLNQVLWSLWYGGGLSFDDLVGYLASVSEGDSDLSDIVSLKLKPALPPVMMPGPDGLEFELGMGDLYVEADINFLPLIGSDDDRDGQIRVGAYITLLSSAGLDIDPTANTLELLMDESPTIAVEVVAIDDEGYQGPMSDLLAKAMKLILPRLLTSTIGSIPLPSFDLGSLAEEGVVPAGTVWELTEGELERDPSGTHLLLTGALE